MERITLPQFSDFSNRLCGSNIQNDAELRLIVNKTYKDPIPVFMELSHVLEEVRKIRGIYETTVPDVDTNLCFKIGRSACQYFNRHPDITKTSFKHRKLILTEVTPIETTNGFLNCFWWIRIIGEADKLYDILPNCYLQ